MPDPQTGTDLKRQLDRAQRFMGEFKEKRQVWDSIIARTHPTLLPKELRNIQQGIYYQSPIAEKAVQDLVDVLTMNPTVFAIASEEQGERAKKDLRKILLYHARQWDKQNKGRWWDSAVGEG